MEMAGACLCARGVRQPDPSAGFAFLAFLSFLSFLAELARLACLPLHRLRAGCRVGSVPLRTQPSLTPLAAVSRPICTHRIGRRLMQRSGGIPPYTREGAST